MSFEQEWSRASETAMRLNGAGSAPTGGGGRADLVVTPSDKAAAAKFIKEDLGPAATYEGGKATLASTSVFGSSNTTHGVLRGWDTRKGLDFCLERWGEAWQKISHRLRGEMNALYGTKTAFEVSEADRVRSLNKALEPVHGSRLNDL
ncbi:hypothetical protein [Streptomyces reniochalinae]|uniref:WXG100 family type VII secretion target n=1 Tax=Streptomyces reniochalinae TaxID=2250578 RepID=A0A367EB39_9ACTN|nr:hypothetical protein [Streptomyces reniochalinae]RCG15009.1 hypothetical protein DQ392_28615 [Streptomyces reniochalinae]